LYDLVTLHGCKLAVILYDVVTLHGCKLAVILYDVVTLHGCKLAMILYDVVSLYGCKLYGSAANYRRLAARLHFSLHLTLNTRISMHEFFFEPS